MKTSEGSVYWSKRKHLGNVDNASLHSAVKKIIRHSAVKKNYSATSEAFRKFSEILLSRAFLISAPRLSHKAVFDKRCNIKQLNTCFPKLPEKKFLAFNDAFRRCFIETTPQPSSRSRLTIVKCVLCKRERKLFFSFDQRCAIKIFFYWLKKKASQKLSSR